MSDYILHTGALVTCKHEGIATPTAVDEAVTVSGMPIVVQTDTYGIIGCTLPPPPGANGPCATAKWLTAALRVKASGIPVLLANSESLCASSGMPLTVDATQLRAKAT